MTNEYNEEVEHIVKCNECLSRDIINDHDKGEIYCGACGLVLQDEMLEESSLAAIIIILAGLGPIILLNSTIKKFSFKKFCQFWIRRHAYNNKIHSVPDYKKDKKTKPQDGSRRAPEATTKAPKGPQSDPKGPQRAPRRPKRPPKGPKAL